MSDRAAPSRSPARTGMWAATLRAAFGASGYRVIALQRSAPAADATCDYVPYSLEDGPAAGCPTTWPRSSTAPTTCAHATAPRSNGSTSAALRSSSARSGTSRLFSSPRCPHTRARSRSTAAPSSPARTSSPRTAGRHCGSASSTAAPTRGMIGALRKVAALPLVPMLRPDSYQYAIHAEDMARCVLATVEQPPPHRVLGVANPRRVPFSEIIRTLRAAATSKSLRPIPVSSTLLYRALRAGEAVGVRIGFRADSLLGLMHPAPDVPHVGYWAERGISLRDFATDTTR